EDDDPIMKLPAGTLTITGQFGQCWNARSEPSALRLVVKGGIAAVVATLSGWATIAAGSAGGVAAATGADSWFSCLSLCFAASASGDVGNNCKKAETSA